MQTTDPKLGNFAPTLNLLDERREAGMKNEYQVLNYPECVDGRDLENTLDREDLVNMLGFCTNGDGARDGSGRAGALEGIPMDALVTLIRDARCR